MTLLSEPGFSAGLRFIALGAGGSEPALLVVLEPLGRLRMAMALSGLRRIERLAMLRFTIAVIET